MFLAVIAKLTSEIGELNTKLSLADMKITEGEAQGLKEELLEGQLAEEKQKIASLESEVQRCLLVNDETKALLESEGKSWQEKLEKSTGNHTHFYLQ